jgi:hypothetical protein
MNIRVKICALAYMNRNHLRLVDRDGTAQVASNVRKMIVLLSTVLNRACTLALAASIRVKTFIFTCKNSNYVQSLYRPASRPWLPRARARSLLLFSANIYAYMCVRMYAPMHSQITPNHSARNVCAYEIREHEKYVYMRNMCA